MTKSATPQYLNRELSWIEFNSRVLAEAMDETSPIFERLKFMGIVSSNFDEFFMVRVGAMSEDDPMLSEVYGKAFESMRRQNDYFSEKMTPGLAAAGIQRKLPQELSEKHRDYLRELFTTELMPLLTPIAIRPEQASLPVVNLSLYRTFELCDPRDKANRLFAVVEIPKNYPRMVSLPNGEGLCFILLEDVVSLYANDFFQGYEVAQHGLMRLTSAAEMTVDEEKDEDFMEVMSEALRERRRNSFVRMENASPPGMTDFFARKLGISKGEIFQMNPDGWFDLKTISQIAFSPAYEHLRRPKWEPRPCPEIQEADDLWEVIRQKDILIHHPYESFDAVIRFLAEAAADPDVLAIKQTLYRAAENSAVIRNLEKAAESGKQVTVLVELKARFDEQQ
ncbi:polyphosphate kinase 1, partial [Omnitrophica bacterium]|nr:polyphosphate kinase 1 [Candidatus Omnitrophota bacterium]